MSETVEAFVCNDSDVKFDYRGSFALIYCEVPGCISSCSSAVILFCAIRLLEHQDLVHGCRKRLRRYVTKKKMYQDSYVYTKRGYVIIKIIED